MSISYYWTYQSVKSFKTISSPKNQQMEHIVLEEIVLEEIK